MDDETGKVAGDGPGFICFSAQDWWYHNQGHSDIQLMRRVAKSRKVLFVNSITMRMPRPGRTTRPLRRIGRKAASFLRLVRRPLAEVPDLHVMTPLFLPVYGIPWARSVNARLVRIQVSGVARALGIHDPVMFVTIPTAWEVVEPMSRRSLIFNRSDKHSAFVETNQDYIRSLEDALLAHSDRVLYVSHALMDEETAATGRRAYFLDHGVDLDHFRFRSTEPADLESIPHPRIGFFGGLDDYVVDFDLLERVAREIPTASLVLIGDATCSMERLERLPNVHWLGHKPYEQIPSYGSGFDVALMPWLINDWVRSSNPIKLKEYLALGLPTVTTDFPEAHLYAEELEIATDADAFVAKVSLVLGLGEGVRPVGPTGAAMARRASVIDSSWDVKAEILIRVCEGLS